jgi:hypothetical protein
MASGVVSPTGIGACLLPSDAFGKIFCIEVVAGTPIASCMHENTNGEREKRVGNQFGMFTQKEPT